MKTDLVKSSTELSRVAIVFNYNNYNLSNILTDLYSFYGGVRFMLFPCDEDHIKDLFYKMLIQFDPDILVILGDVKSELLEKLKVTNPIKTISHDKFKDSFIKLEEILDQKEEVPDLFYNNLNKTEKLLFPEESYHSISKAKYYIGKPVDYYDYIEKIFCKGLTQISGFYSHDNVNNDCSIDKVLVKDKENPLCSRWGLIDFYSRGYQCLIISNENIYDLCLLWNLRNYYWRKDYRQNLLVVEKNNINRLVDLISNPSFFINIFSFSTTENELKKLKKELESKHKKNEYFLKVNINPTPPVLFHSYSNRLESEEKIVVNEDEKSKYLLKWSKLDITPSYLSKITSMDINNMVPMPKNIQEYKDLISNFKNESKVSIDGIRFLSSNSPFIYLQKLDSFKLISNVLKNRGFTVSLSDKGEIGLNLLKQFNTIDDIKILYNKKIINLIKNNQGKVIDHDTIKQLDINISAMIKNKILLQGFTLKCQSCKKVNWSSSIDFQSKYTCQHCYDSIELDLKYETKFKINELFSLAYKQGVITHLFSILEIMNKKRIHGQGLFHYLPGALIKEMNREIDFIIIDEEGLKIGECKNDAKELDNQEIDSVIHISNEINANKLFFCSLKNGFSKQNKTKFDNGNIAIIENIVSKFE